MNLIINNHIIDADVEDILHQIHKDTNGRYLNQIIRRGENIAVTCPTHKDGREQHPSCYVYNNNSSDSVPYGWYRCFTCNDQGPLYKLVSICLSLSEGEAKQWLVDNYSNTLTEAPIDLPIIDLKSKSDENVLDESILEEYSYFHPYMFERGLTEDVIRKFKIGYNIKTDSITFPVWNEHDKLVGITERNVKSKFFHIPENMGKPIYLLNYVLKNNITEAVVCESQLDALKCWVWGIPAIALLGTGSKKQYKILNSCGIRFYHLALDGDIAGDHGVKRFIENIKKDVFIDVVQIPKGKDVNDLSKEEFLALERQEV